MKPNNPPLLFPIIGIFTLVAVGIYGFSSGSKTVNQNQEVAEIKAPERLSPTGLVETESFEEFKQRIINGDEIPPLTAEQLEAFVESRERDVESLLVALKLSTGESEREHFLAEAAERFPDSPAVALAMLETVSHDSESRSEWISKLKENDPENAAGFLLGARAAVKAGDLQQALNDLTTAGTLERTEFASSSKLKVTIEAYQFSGYEGLKGKLLGVYSMDLPFVAQMKSMNTDFSSAMALAMDTNDHELAQSLGKASLKAAALVTHSSKDILTTLVGSAMERSILDQLGALDLVPGDDQLVFEREEALNSIKTEIKEVMSADTDFLQVGEEQTEEFFDRMTTHGELEARRWLSQQ